jgi:hypothetical protein
MKHPLATLRRNFPLLLCSLALSCAALVAKDKSKQLARVAKDWALTIRASQILPTYPLTEDLQPGDVFVTSTPVGDEVRLFEEKGFLPLDNHLARIGSAELKPVFDAFYAGRPAANGSAFPAQVPWDHMPDAKFPSYTFEVSRSGGLNLAIPVQGVPVGFNYLGAARATGSVTIAQATTIGLDIEGLNGLVDAWAGNGPTRALLASYGTVPGDAEARPVFVRIVSRVYFAQKVAVHLADGSSSGAAGQAGTASPLDLPSEDPIAKSTAERQQELVGKLNEALPKEIGANVKIVSASSRSITLDETFTRPVVIGYLAYDRQILPGGELGPPVSTLARVSGRNVLVPNLANFDSAGLITAWYTKDETTRRPAISAWLAANFPGVDMATFISQAPYQSEHLRMIQELGIR